MKKLIIAALAASIVATPAMAAPGWKSPAPENRVEQRHDNRASAHRVEQRRDNQRQVTVRRAPQQQRQVAVRYAPQQQRQIAHRNWRKGDRFDSRYASNYRVISQPRSYGLRAAPNGHRWVQSGNDALLIGITSGIVSSIVSSVIR